MVDASNLPVAVMGASGKLGRLIVRSLLDHFHVPADKIIAVTRSPQAVADLASRGVVVRVGDYDQPDTLVPAVRGAKRMLVMSTMGVRPYVDGQRAAQQIAAVNAGIAAGVGHIFYTSAPNPEPGTPAFWKHDHYRTEVALMKSGARWTIMRHWEWPNWHYSENWLLALKTGRYYTGCGNGAINWVTREDHARADAGALVSNASANRRYDLTGAEPIDMDRTIRMFSRTVGQPIEVNHCEPEELGTHLVAAGTHPDVVPFLIDGARAVRRGLYAGTTNHIQELTGVAPTTLQQWLDANASTIRAREPIP